MSEIFSKKNCFKTQNFCHLELPVTLPPATKGPEEGSVRVENLDPVVSGVRHKDEAAIIDCHTPVVESCWSRTVAVFCRQNYFEPNEERLSGIEK